MLPSLSEVPAPHKLRFTAWVVDLLLVGPAALALGMVLTSRLPPLAENLHAFRLGLVGAFVVLALVAYQGLLVGLTGQTFGKALFNLRVMRIRKRPPGILWSTGRAVGSIFVDVFGVGSAWALRDVRHHCLHDLVFHSQVMFLQGSPLKARNLLHRLDAALEEKEKRFSRPRRLVYRLVRSLGITDLARRLLNRLIGGAEGGGAAAGATSAMATSAVPVSSTVAAASGLSVPATAALAIVTATATMQHLPPPRSASQLWIPSGPRFCPSDSHLPHSPTTWTSAPCRWAASGRRKARGSSTREASR